MAMGEQITRCTLRLRKDLWDWIRIEAINRDTTANALCEDWLTERVVKEQEAMKRTQE